MRVTHIITRLIVGGAQENTLASVLGLGRKAGLNVDLISGRSEGREGSLEHLLEACPGTLQIVPQLVRPVRPWTDWLALRRLTALLRKRHPDIVHTHSGKAGVLGRLAAARAGVPLIIHTIHGPSFGCFQGPLPNLAFRLAEQYAARVTSHFVVVADAMKEKYLEAGIGQPEQYTRIFSGFDLEPFLAATNDLQLRARFGIGAQDFVIGKIARLCKLKGHADLFAIAPTLVRSLPQTKFLIVGDGEYRDKLEGWASASGLAKHFIFTGLVEPETVAGLVGIMDVVVHLSSREGLARALPQALAAARPVIAYDCDGAREVCLENKTGFLVRLGDLEGLTERLMLLAPDQGLRARLGHSGREFVRSRFSVETMVDELYELYGRLTSKAAPSCARAVTG
jgi:glycosyltransferase involved in cell wall biosynthesis